MLRLVGLLLGAAVQSDQREVFIERLKSMRPQLQHALIAEIQRVTKDGDCVISLETLQELVRQHGADENGVNCYNEALSSDSERSNDESKSADEPNNKTYKDEDAKKQHILTSLIECVMKDRDDYATALLDIVTAHAADSTTSQNGEYSPISSCYTTSNTNSEATSGVATMDESLDYPRGGGRGSPLPIATDTATTINSDKPPAPASLTSMKVMSTSTTSSIASSAGGAAQGVSDVHGFGMFSSGIATTCDGRNVSAVEHATLKAEVRKLRNQNEQYEELQMYLQEDIEHRDAQISKLQAERLELIKDARAAKDYRDEIDCMQHKIIRLERLETENEKLKSKLSEVNFYKTRVNSLKEDNDLMQNTYRELEEQLEQCQRKMTSYLELDKRMIESQAHVKSLQLDLTKTREQVEDLLVENGRLERESKEHAQKCLELQRRIDMTASAHSPRDLVGVFGQTPPSPGGVNASLNDSSLLAQLDACNQTQLLELQLENRKLKLQLESATNAANPGELFEIRAELIESKKIIEARASEKSELIIKLNAEKEALAKASAVQASLRQRLNETELALSEVKRNASTTNQEQMDELKTKLAYVEQEATAKAQDVKLLSEEKEQLEMQLDKMRSQQKSARADIDRLQEALSNAEQNRDVLERTKRSLENERIALKSRVDAASERVGELERHLKDAENIRQANSQLEQQLRDKTEELTAAESTNLAAKKQIEYSTQKEAQLREELNGERTRIAELVERLRAVCTSINLNSESNEPDNELRDVLNNDAQLVATIDEVLMRAFNTTRRESDALRIQQKMQIRELDDLKRDIEALRKAESELPAATDKYTEMIIENKNIKEQVTILQERLRRLQIDEATRCAELQAARREIDELQQKINAELCNLRTAVHNAQVQEDILKRNVSELQARLDVVLAERNDAQHASRTLATVNQALATDHDRLQQLHHALTSDYESAKLEAGALKQRMKAEKAALESSLHAEFESERVAIEAKLAAEAAERQRFFQKLVNCEAELSAASKELLELKFVSRRERSPPVSGCYSTSSHFQQSQNLAAESHELRRLRLLECAQKSTINNLNMTIQQLNNLLTEKDLEIANLRRQIDMLRQYNGEESRSLIRQIELLLIQNQQLHTRSDVFYAEQKELREKLAQLRRHKEKLEEKIMDQYKAMDSRKIEAKPTFVRRAAKALISKSPGRKLSTTRPGATAAMKRDGASSSNTEDSSVYSADEGLFTSSANGSGASPIPAPPTVPPPAQNNDMPTQVPLHWNSGRPGIVNKFGIKTDVHNGSGHHAVTLTSALTAHQNHHEHGQLSSVLQRFTKSGDQCGDESPDARPLYQTLLPRDRTRRAQSLTSRRRATTVGDTGDYSTLESLRRDSAVEERKVLEPASSTSSSARSSPWSESSGAYTMHTTDTNMCDAATKSVSRRDLAPNHSRQESTLSDGSRFSAPPETTRTASAKTTPTRPMPSTNHVIAALPPITGPLPAPNFSNGFLSSVMKGRQLSGTTSASSVRGHSGGSTASGGTNVDATPLRTRNGRLGGSLRFAPANPLIKSASYADRPFPLPLKSILNGERHNKRNESTIAGDGSIVNVKYNGAEKGIDVLNSTVQTLSLHSQRPSVSELPPRAPSHMLDARPPPPPYLQADASPLSIQRSGSCNAKSHHAPPPPYPGRLAEFRKPSPTKPTSPAGFFPRDTSTPKSSSTPATPAAPLAAVVENEPPVDPAERHERTISYYENVNNNNSNNINTCLDRKQHLTTNPSITTEKNISADNTGNDSNNNNINNKDEHPTAKLITLGAMESTVLANGKSALWCEYGCV